MPRPNAKLLNSLDLLLPQAEVRQDGQNYLCVRGTAEYSKLLDHVKHKLQPGDRRSSLLQRA